MWPCHRKSVQASQEVVPEAAGHLGATGIKGFISSSVAEAGADHEASTGSSHFSDVLTHCGRTVWEYRWQALGDRQRHLWQQDQQVAEWRSLHLPRVQEQKKTSWCIWKELSFSPLVLVQIIREEKSCSNKWGLESKKDIYCHYCNFIFIPCPAPDPIW